ncbi:MAG: chromosome segregation protein SMC [Gammaproteobacteria bacterium]|nr:chromosome segregation protein SMC [Gammaproteobacteria bacterium]
MKLSTIKLAGFKSFVDPTNIPLTSNLTGIVGPNGCGKSNVIDAVRWVMGESSAKHLRGDSMADVIFNGSSARKPVGQASIELIFDNSDGKIGGQFASFGEISVRRKVGRDGASAYYLNGARCRRKDITSLFLGTGLGPRGYSIIEQGTISRIIEAKPEELRTYLEEAAGISKYKERRRETENRIRHTRDNLDRLSDLRDEVSKQLEHLQRQKRGAERYQRYQTEKRQIEAELIVLRLRELNTDNDERERQLSARQTELEAKLSDLRGVETRIEKTRAGYTDAQDKFNQVQETFYKVGADIARLEQDLQHRRDLKQRQKSEFEELKQQVDELEQHLQRDEVEVKALEKSLLDLEPGLVAAKQEQQQAESGLQKLQQQNDEAEGYWQKLTTQLAQNDQALEVARTDLQHHQRYSEELGERQQRLSTDQTGNDLDQRLQDLEQLRSAQSEHQQKASTAHDQLEMTQKELNGRRLMRDEINERVQSLRDQLAHDGGRKSSLEALQAHRESSAAPFHDWLDSHGWKNESAIWQNLKVEEPWAPVVEMVLSPWLEAVTIADTAALTAAEELEQGQAQLMFFDEYEANAEADRLASKVQAPAPVIAVLNQVRVAPDVATAWSWRPGLQAGESIVTADGVWLGANWLCINRGSTSEDSVLAREAELRQLETTVDKTSAKLEETRSQLKECDLDIEKLEQQVKNEFSAVREFDRALSESSARFEEREQRHQSFRARLLAAQNEQGEVVNLIENAERKTAELRDTVDRYTTRKAELVDEHQQARQQYESAKTELELGRRQAEEARTLSQTLSVQLESQKSSQSTASNALERAQRQLEQSKIRQTELSSGIAGSDQPITDGEQQLQTQLQQRVEVEEMLADARTTVETLESEQAKLEQTRIDADQTVQTVREAINDIQLNAQETRVRRQTLLDQLKELNLEFETIDAELKTETTVEAWQDRLEKVNRRITRLGAINLAAIEEFDEQSERKQYLDAQNDDLTEGLETLEKAIKKIDAETKERFKETYDQVNEGLQRLFPKLFGGGKAYLELNDSDLLNAGVTVMARPPGKRNSTIHLLSGGEKALTAVALVFAIFELNPAPFCLLDEVDAPLDDNNVGRFCEIVREMSDHIQFVIITHNKVTMEMVHQLTGVTMQEAGVSRLVAVDLDQAVEMAAVQ